MNNNLVPLNNNRNDLPGNREQEVAAALLVAVLAGNVAEIARIAGVFDPSSPLEQGKPALWHAIHASQQDSIRALIEVGAQINNAVISSDGYRGPLLNEAIFMNNLPLVRLLLELGADPNVGGSEFSRLPLLTAFGLEGADRRKMVEVLVLGGANPNKIIRVEEPVAQARNPYSRNIRVVESSLLNYFMHLNDRDAISILMGNGANPRMIVDGVSPYNLAVAYEDEEYKRQFAPPMNRRRHALALLGKTRKHRSGRKTRHSRLRRSRRNH